MKNILKKMFSLSDLYSVDNKVKHKVINVLGLKIKIKVKVKQKHKVTTKEIKEFVKTYYCSNYNAGSDFVSYANTLYERKSKDAKLLAFYLPQYHRIPVNDKYHGEGFTDWKNVTSSIPQFTGHYQPQLPADCGFYDLSNPKVLEEQTRKAQNYGIYGFCYHYYWFSGDRLLEKPIFDMLDNKNITMPYCLCWANENWSKLWDGGNKELIKKQELKSDDTEKFFNDILPFFKDERYIKIDNKPLLIIYRPNVFSKDLFKDFIEQIRNLAIKQGFDGLRILSSNANFFDSPLDWCLDGLVEFPPHQLVARGIKQLDMSKRFINKDFVGQIFDMEDFVNNRKYEVDFDYPVFKGVFPSWDNSSRKAYSNAWVFEGLTPELYKKWLKGCIKYTKETKKENEQFVFINAWNEWAEGAHLEADLKYGYAYLQATKEALEE